MVAENPDSCSPPSPSVCFEFSCPLVDTEILRSAHSAIPYLAMLNNKALKVKGLTSTVGQCHSPRLPVSSVGSLVSLED